MRHRTGNKDSQQFYYLNCLQFEELQIADDSDLSLGLTQKTLQGKEKVGLPNRDDEIMCKLKERH